MVGPDTARAKVKMAEWLAAVGLVLALSACGSDGKAGVAFLPDDGPAVGKITGVVFAPNGEFAAVEPWWQWAGLVTRAYAIQNFYVQPVGPGTIVNLALVGALDAADGRIDTPQPIVSNVATDAEGRYEIIDPIADNVDVCRLMVSVGSPGSGEYTRAFVSSTITDIDPASEALVRIVLDRVANKKPPVQLCDFTSEGLAELLEAVSRASSIASGATVAEVNSNAFAEASRNSRVKRILDAVTGVPVVP